MVPGQTTAEPPTQLVRRYDLLRGRLQELERQIAEQDKALGRIRDYLSLDTAISDALDQLSEKLFGRIVALIEEKLTLALQDVLEQNLQLKVTRDFKRGQATIAFHVERDGCAEDIMLGQGGSVANVLSVGLRLFALKTLDESEHQRFLVLDEQDCWLRPDLVPRFVRIIHEAGRALGFQVIMVSHHDFGVFAQYADKVYEFTPGQNGVEVRELRQRPATPDE